MTGSIPPPVPLAYEGQVVVPYINRTFDPNSGNNTFPIPTLWVNTAASLAWLCVSKAGGVAVWLPIGGGSTQVETLTGNTGGPVPPTAGNINVVGDTTTITVAGNPSTSTLTISAVGSGLISTITTPDSQVVHPVSGNINFLEAGGITITGNDPTSPDIKFTVTGGGISWVDVTGTTQQMAINTGYVSDNGSLVTLTLPATAAFGDVVEVAGKGAGGWKIAQNAGQIIHCGQWSTTSGTGGSVASTNQYDGIMLLCVTANTTFVMLNSVGNLTLV